MSATEAATASPGIDRPTVTLLAYTEVTDAALELLDAPGVTTAPDHLAELAGRACYASFSRPNPKTAANADYLANVLGQGHESVVSHASASFYLTGVSRSFTHELIRHRYLSFSELSQRYCAADDFRAVYPPAAGLKQRARIDRTMAAGIAAYEQDVEDYLADGFSRKEAREAARAHLPGCTETRIVVSGNLRAWRNFLEQRLSPAADREIQAVARLLLADLVKLAPATFAALSNGREAK